MSSVYNKNLQIPKKTHKTKEKQNFAFDANVNSVYIEIKYLYSQKLIYCEWNMKKKSSSTQCADLLQLVFKWD